MKMKKLMVALLALAMLATGTIGNEVQVKADTPPEVYFTDKADIIVNPGETTHVKLPIQARDQYINAPIIEVKATSDNAPFTFSKPTLSMNDTKMTGISYVAPTDLEFDVTTGEAATIGSYSISINFQYEVDYLTDDYKPFTLSAVIKVQQEKTPAQLTVSNVALANTNVGCNTNLTFTVKNEGELAAKSAYVVINYNDAKNGGDIIEERYSAKEIKIGDLAAGETKNLLLPVTILSSATAGRKTLVADFTYKTVDGGSALKSSYSFNIKLTTNESAPKLTVKDVKFADSLKPGDKFTLSVVLENSGKGSAKDITATIDDASVDKDGIIKNYYTDGVSVKLMDKGDTASFDLPLKVSKYATGGVMKSIKLVVNYTDKAGVAYTLNESVYVDVTGEAATGTPDLIISNVSQSPAKPVAGDKLEVSFVLENKSNVDANEVKISTEGLTSENFTPVDAEPYQYIEKLKAGEKVNIKIPLIVSTSIPEGLNNLTIKIRSKGSTDPITEIIPIRDVKNDLGSKSKPKLIVSKYFTDLDELKAGSTFNFTFDIYNTHASVAAKNITVTLTQADNIFTVTKGSNSFFINRIDPGETVENTIELKVKSDASTKAYPIKLAIQYEYDGIEPNKETGAAGEVESTPELNLQVVENARPVCDNVQVYSFDGNITVGNPATLSFDFYNMGKSVLNNVIATVEGDGFSKADGSMYFIGNVEAGASSYVEFDVTPNVEGTASGVLRLSYEDSNGETIEFTKDFSQEVMPAGGAVIPGDMSGGAGEVFNPDGALPAGKKDILPIWAFVLVQIGIFVLFVPITRKIIISAYKSKLRKKEFEQY